MAAGVLNQQEQVIRGADGRPYKSRTDTIEIDSSLTEAILVNKDPTKPIVEDITQSWQNLPDRDESPNQFTSIQNLKSMPTIRNNAGAHKASSLASDLNAKRSQSATFSQR